MNSSYGIGDGLRLMRTCKQICDEATSVFYGKNLFHFADTFGTLLDDDDWGPGGWCELDSLPIWLRYIGRHNVLRIRTLRITVLGIRPAFGPGDSDKLDDVSPAGEGLIQGFDYLSFGHHIHTLEFRFPCSEDTASEIKSERGQGFSANTSEDSEVWEDLDGKAYPLFFRRIDTAVLKALRKVKGVEEFKCPDLHDIWPSAAHVMRTIKAEIESPESKGAQAKQSKMVLPLPHAGRTSKEEPKLSIRERLVVVEQERAENINLLGKLLGNLRKQGDDIGGLMKQVQDLHNTVG